MVSLWNFHFTFYCCFVLPEPFSAFPATIHPSPIWLVILPKVVFRVGTAPSNNGVVTRWSERRFAKFYSNYVYFCGPFRNGTKLWQVRNTYRYKKKISQTSEQQPQRFRAFLSHVRRFHSRLWLIILHCSIDEKKETEIRNKLFSVCAAIFRRLYAVNFQ